MSSDERSKPPNRAERAALEATEDARLATLSPNDRARALVARFGLHQPPITSEGAQKRLVAMGAEAVSALVAHLGDANTGWQAAHTLAEIGAPDALGAADALWKHASRGSKSHASMWSTVALARLGRLDAVASLIDLDVGAYNVASGLAAVTPESYPWIERALDRRDDAITAAFADSLRPGRGRFFAPNANGFDDALKGSRSPHAIVRMDAALVLVHKAFPRATQALALSALAVLARDGDAEVRRLAALSMGRVGAKARTAAIEALRVLVNDPIEKVQEAARYSVQQLTHAK